MNTGDYDPPLAPGLVVAQSWQATVILGTVTLFLGPIGGIAGGVAEGMGWWIAFGAVSLIAGIVVTATPVSSVTVLAVLLGIWFIVIGALEIIGGSCSGARRAMRKPA